MAIDQIDNLRKFTITSQVVANPAAGADWSVTVPTGQIWRVRSIFAQLVSSATVANRQPFLQIKDAGGNFLFLLDWGTAQTASLTSSYTWGGSCPLVNNGTSIFVGPIPQDMVLAEGSTISASTASIQTGDQWQKVCLLVEQAQAL